MSLNQLDLNERKLWLVARVEDLLVDTSIIQQEAVAAVTTAVTAAQLQGGIINCNSTGNVNLTFPTASQIWAQFPLAKVGSVVRIQVCSVGGNCTITAPDGTVVTNGTMVIATNSARHISMYFTSANLITLY
jgi:hypothetical protein